MLDTKRDSITRGRSLAANPLGGTSRVRKNGMTLFEYISVAFSIVLSLGVATLLGALRRIFSRDRRYWVHATWVLTVLLMHAIAWWSLWSFSAVESWTILTFFLVLLQPGVLFLIASTLVGDEPATTESWHEHFYRVRKWFFSARAVYMVAVIAASWQVLDIELTHPARLFGASHIALSMVGISTTSERIHALLVVLEALLTLGAASVIFLEPTRWGAF
jgi:hypothetical protein